MLRHVASEPLVSIPLRPFIRARSAATAVEFSLIAPIFLAMLFGMVTYGTLLSTYSGVQQLAAEAARASLAGLSAGERAQIARSFVTANVSSYPFLDPTRLIVTTATLTTPTPAFQVTVQYDLSSMFVYQFSRLVPMPPSTFVRSAVVQCDCA